MAKLFKTLADLRSFLPVSTSFSKDEIIKYEDYALEHYISDWIDSTTLETLISEYAADPSPAISSEMAALLPYVQKTVAFFTFYEFIPFAELTINDAGITRLESNNQKTAYSKQILSLQRSTLKTAYNNLETLLKFLEDNSADYADWASSDESSLNRAYFINSSKVFSKSYPLKYGRQTFKSLFNVMNDVEQFELIPLLGESFFNELKTKIEAKTTLNTYEKKALTYIQNAVANLTIAQAITQKIVDFTPSGIINKEIGENTGYEMEKTPSADAISTKILSANTIGTKYLDKLHEYLQNNIDEFPTYRDDTTVNPDTTSEDPYNLNSEGSGFYVV